MLFLLTGNIQIGKTRWLMRTLSELEERGVTVCGAVAPGIWRHRCPQEIEQEGGSDACGEYEKLGIDVVLLPQRERFSFARPAAWFVRGETCSHSDAPSVEPGSDGIPHVGHASAQGKRERVSQSRQAKLAWDISEDALAVVNAHFEALREHAAPDAVPGLLVIDELGWLELCRDGGLTSALRMVDAGPTEAFPHVLAIVREDLLELAHQRFCEAWHGNMADISPDEDSARLLFETLA